MNVLDFNKALILDGHYWHKMSEQLRLKYGSDWSHRYGFDKSKLTDKEYDEYCRVFKECMIDRGIPESQIRNPI